MRSGDAQRTVWIDAGRALSTTLLVLLAAAASLLPATAARPNGAGIVIQFEDGSRIYAYVQFSEETISSEQLLTRSGLDVIMAPFGGMGAAVCSIQGQGCPSSNCFCQSYTFPAYYWHFYAWNGAGWVEQLQGSTSRAVADGDIDGWLWTSGDTALPPTTIEEIAAINGIDLTEPDPTPTATPSPEPTATHTLAPEPTATPEPTSTATVGSSPTPASTASPTASPVTTDAPSQTPSATSTSAPLPTTIAPPASTAAATVRATSTSPPEPTATHAPLPALTVQPDTTAVAAFVPAGGTPVPLDTTRSDDGPGMTVYAVFAGMLAIGLGAAGFVMLRARAAQATERTVLDE